MTIKEHMLLSIKEARKSINDFCDYYEDDFSKRDRKNMLKTFDEVINGTFHNIKPKYFFFIMDAMGTMLEEMNETQEVIYNLFKELNNCECKFYS